MITALHVVQTFKAAAAEGIDGPILQSLPGLIDRLAPSDRQRFAKWLTMENERERLGAEVVKLEYEIYHEAFEQAMAILDSHGFTAELLTLDDVVPMLSLDEQETVGTVIAHMASRSRKMAQES